MRILQFVLSLLLFVSCTYSPDGLTFVDVKKTDSIPALDLTLSFNSDSIYLYTATNISFSLKMAGQDFSYAEIRYYDNVIKTYETDYTFTVVPQGTTDWKDLTIDFYVATGSGSLASQLKSEFTKVTKTWKIKSIDIKTVGLHSGYRIHKDGYLQVYLVKPNGDSGLTYQCSSSYTADEPVESGDTLFYAAKSYLSGIALFNFYVKATGYYSIYSESLTVNLPDPKFEISEYLGDSCILNCTSSPIKCYYGFNKKILQGTSASWKVPYAFDSNGSVYLSQYAPGDNQGLSLLRTISASLTPITTQRNYLYCYSLGRDKFYLSTDASYPELTNSSYPLPVGVEWFAKPKMKVACSPNGNYIAGYYNSKIYVYGESLKSDIQIPVDPMSNSLRYLAVTNDGAVTYLKGAEVVMKNLTGTGWQSFSFTSNADPNALALYVSNISNSIDGKYVCVRGATDFKIYDVSNHTSANVIYENASGDIRGAIAHPTNPGLMYIKKVSSIELRSLPTYDLVKTINLPFTSFYMHSLDPYSNLFVLSSGSYYYFMNAESGAIVYKLRSIWDVSNYETTLNRYQLTSGSRIVDLTNLIK